MEFGRDFKQCLTGLAIDLVPGILAMLKNNNVAKPEQLLIESLDREIEGLKANPTLMGNGRVSEQSEKSNVNLTKVMSFPFKLPRLPSP